MTFYTLTSGASRLETPFGDWPADDVACAYVFACAHALADDVPDVAGVADVVTFHHRRRTVVSPLSIRTFLRWCGYDGIRPAMTAG